ncbi:MAG: CoA transferase [Hyphomonadaceae bacterium]
MAERALSIGAPRFAVLGANQAVLHAVRWLSHFGAQLIGVKNFADADALDPSPAAVLIAGDAYAGAREDGGGVPRIWLWDYEVGRPGSGEMACAVSGVSTVIGEADGPPGVMPAHIAEKWCGLFGASLALSLLLAQAGRAPQRIDVSAADALRAFAEQNSGNHAGVPYGWRRNGRTAVEHGGVFPQGFFPCRDGFMAVQARSRPDWQAILAALGNPAWGAEMQNPFKLSEDDSIVRPLLEAELGALDRAELLRRAAETGAPMAPVLTAGEAANWRVYREGFLGADGNPGLPFAVRR